MAGAAITTKTVPQMAVDVVRGDDFEGFYLLLLNEDGSTVESFDNMVVRAQIRNQDGTLITSFNTSAEFDEISNAFTGCVRFWLTAEQTELFALSTDPLAAASDCTTLYSKEQGDPFYLYDIRIQQEIEAGRLIGQDAGVFTTDRNHRLAGGDRIVFRDCSILSINNQQYSGLQNLTYRSPFSFRVPSLASLDTATAPQLAFVTSYDNYFQPAFGLGEAPPNGALILITNAPPTAPVVPQNLVNGAIYRVRDSTGFNWRVSLTENGPPVIITGNGMVQYQVVTPLGGRVMRLRRDTLAAGPLRAFSRSSLFI